MAVVRDMEKESFWRWVLEEQSASGLNIREFCRREGVSEPNFLCLAAFDSSS